MDFLASQISLVRFQIDELREELAKVSERLRALEDAAAKTETKRPAAPAAK